MARFRKYIRTRRPKEHSIHHRKCLTLAAKVRQSDAGREAGHARADIGAIAGLCGDRASLGFMAETERKVEGHLEDHLARLPEDDQRSRAIILQMQADEVRHGQTALAAGGAPLPEPVPKVMRLTARIMTRTAYWI